MIQKFTKLQLSASHIQRYVARNASTSTANASPFLKERLASKHHAGQTSDLWRKVSVFVCLPLIVVAAVNARFLYVSHQEHLKKHPKDPEAPQYEYINWHLTEFPWGDGKKTLFWNDKYNFPKPQ